MSLSAKIEEKVKAQTAEHESGHPMIVFAPFQPETSTETSYENLFQSARAQLKTNANIIRICLDPNQSAEREILESLNFHLDGYELGLPVAKLHQIRAKSDYSLPPGFHVRKAAYDKDIEAMVGIEKEVHANDPTSRVNFDTPEAVESMKNYYKRAMAGIGVTLLLAKEQIIGIFGFLPDKKHERAIMISSVAISTSHQGQGLLFPFLFGSIEVLSEQKFDMLTGVTTTQRVLDMSERIGCDLLGLSLVQNQN